MDPSATVELLLRTNVGVRMAHPVLDPAERLSASHLLDLRVAQLLRRPTYLGEISPALVV